MRQQNPKLMHIRPCLWWIILLYTGPLAAQEDFTWWNQKHQWDGITSWQYYLIISPGFFGPNALPVPELQPGLIDSTYTLEAGLAAHFSAGDNTQNLTTELFLPLFSDRVGLRLALVPLEWYRMDTLTRDERRARDFDGRGTAVGDLQIGTHIQIVRDRKGWPDLLLGLHFRTASGGNLEGARYTDAPGYFFDLSAGKRLSLKSRFIRALRPHGMVGFLVYQANSRDQLQRQNDCFLFGAGLDLDLGALRLRQQVAGYIGYLDNRDKPIVYRGQVLSQWKYSLNFGLGVQAGLHEWRYTTLLLTTVWRL